MIEKDVILEDRTRKQFNDFIMEVIEDKCYPTIG